MRRSSITDRILLWNWKIQDWEYLYMHDGALPVPVFPLGSPQSLVPVLRPGGWILTEVHCGPGAHLPEPDTQPHLTAVNGNLERRAR
jgi:hypothetical protein